MKKISVIVPVYNVEDYLDKCVESIVNQTYTNLEIILVDDGSTDSSGNKCDEWASKDERIIVIHKENGGLSDARNTGIELATGEFLSFVDSDDYVSENFLESMYLAMNKYNCELAICNVTTVDEDGKLNEQFYQPFNRLTLAKSHNKYESLSFHSASNKLYKKRLFDTIRYPNGKLYEDLFVYHYILDEVDKTAYTGINSYFYCIRSGSIMTSPYTIRSTDIIYGYYDRAKFLDDRKEYRLADEDYLWVYSRVAIAFSHLDKSVSENKAKLKEVKRLYNSVAFRMIVRGAYSIKQRIRCCVLLLSPSLHELLYPTKHMMN